MEFTLGEDNIVADLLSRPSEGVCKVAMKPGKNDREGKNDVVNIKNDIVWMINDEKEKGRKRKQLKESSIEDILWEEHCRGHYGPNKVYQMLKLARRTVTVQHCREVVG